MKTKLRKISPEELKDAFGEMDDDGLEVLLDEKGEAEFDIEIEKRIQQELNAIRQNVIVASETEVSSVPKSIQATIDKARNEAFAKNQKEETELDAEIVATKSRATSEGEKENLWSRIFGASGFRPLVGVAAILAIGAFFLLQQGETPANSGGAVVLTPGPETGFADPIFVWTTESGTSSSVSLEVVNVKSGEVVASLAGLKSPVAFSEMADGKLLSQGSSYRLRVSDGEKQLAERTFSTTEFAVARSPERESTLEGVIRQCKGFIAAGRPADAWMLWNQLTPAEKTDPQMQELKKQILSLIA